MGPLNGMKVVEIASVGPGPFCAQMLADMGADIISIDRKAKVSGYNVISEKYDVMNRGRRSIAVDLKNPEDLEIVLKLIEKADALIEGFRPGVMERIGIGPEVCLKRNPRLVFGRMTGWGQSGPLAKVAGHDINCLALSGALHAIGHKDRPPVPPLNLVGDFGGGGMLLAFGIMCGIFEAQRSEKGQVVDASMVEGSALMLNLFFGLMAANIWSENRESNLIDGGAHFYGCYETADGKWVSIGSIEPQFYALLLKHAEIADPDFNNQMDSQKWPELKEKLATIFKTKTRDQWCQIMEGTDVCFAPVLSMTEAAQHPHNTARGSFIEVDGVLQVAPAPKFSRTEPDLPKPAPLVGEHNETALKDWGFSEEKINSLKDSGII